MKPKITFLFFLFAGILFAQSKMFTHTATPETISWANVSIMNHPLLNGNPGAKVFISHLYEDVENDHPTGVFYYEGRWYIYREDWEAMVVNSKYMVYVADEADAFQYTITVPMVSFMLDHPVVNGFADKNPVYTHVNVNNNDLCDFNLGFAYDGGFGTWNLSNLSLTDLPAPTTYFITAEGADPDVIGHRHIATSENQTDFGCSIINHPQLNANPNAGIVFSHNYGSVDNPSGNVRVDKTFTLFYQNMNSTWQI